VLGVSGEEWAPLPDGGVELVPGPGALDRAPLDPDVTARAARPPSGGVMPGGDLRPEAWRAGVLGELLRAEGAEVVAVGTGTAPSYKGKNGYPITADTTIDRVRANDFDAVVVPGGWAPDFLRRNAQVLGFVRELNASLAAEGAAPIEIGIGLNAGEALCGHVGSPERHEYSAIGDVTNVASRLQSLTKEHGYRMLLSNAVAELLKERAQLAPLGPVPVKGHSPVDLFGYSEVQ